MNQRVNLEDFSIEKKEKLISVERKINIEP